MGHGRPSRRARTELRAQGRSYGAGLINPPHRHNRCLMQPRKPWHAMRWGDGWRRSRSRLSASSRLVNQPDGASLLTTRICRRRRFVFFFFPLPSPLLSSAVLYSRYSTYFRHGPPSGSHRLAARLLTFLPACPTAEEVEGAMDAAQRIAPAAARLRRACPFVCSAVCPSCSPIARCGLKAGRAVAQTQRGRL